MEDKRKDNTGTPPPLAVADTASHAPDVPSVEAPTSRRRGGGHKRKASAIGSSGASSTPPSTSSKRHAREAREAREKQLVVPFPPIHNGPLTRARQQPNNAAGAGSPLGFGVKSESEVPPKAEGGGEEAVKVDKESNKAKEDLEALENEIEAEIEAIRSRNPNVHVVPTHAGWFSWSKVHPLEKRTMPSFFNEKSQSRTPEIYMEIRNWIMKKYHTDPNSQIELNDLSELSAGDLDVKQEVMEFLDYWGLINYHPFPQTNSVMQADIDADEAAKTDSLIDKLFRFESDETWTPVLPRSSVATPSVSSGFFPESAIAEELMKSEGPAVEYHCDSCSADCSRKRYHCQKEADFDLCSECFNNGKFGSGMVPSDFLLMEPGEAGGASGGKWTDQETLLLLEALELYKENWNEIAEHVATKTKAQCILHFIEMPIEDIFLDTDPESNKRVKENEDAVLSKDDTSAGIDAPETTESKDDGNDNQFSSMVETSSTVETSKPENVNGLTPQEEVGENCALNALRDAFTAVGFYPPPGERVSFAEADNPVMALAAFLVKLVEAKRVTASVRSSLKSISSNPSGEQLALRHCFVLEDPPDDGKTSPDSDRPANGSVDLDDKKDEDGNVEMEKEEKLTSVTDENGLTIGQDKETKGEANVDKKCEEPDGENHEEKNEEELEEATHLVSTSDENPEKSDTVKQSGQIPTDKEGEPASLKEPDDAGLAVGQTPSTTAESDVLVSNLELPPGFEKESVDGALVAIRTDSPDTPKDEDMMPALQTKEPEQSMKSNSALEIDENKGAGEAKDTVDGRKDPLKTKDDLDIDKIKHAAVTALSAAAVKAKYLADQEEDQIRQLTTSLIEKQLHKLESKLTFFNDMDNVVMRVRELLERSKQRLIHERNQIIASRYGSSARPMPPSVPANRPGVPPTNSVPRHLTAMSSQRLPNSRPIIAGTPIPSSFMSTAVSGNSMQPSK
ncbi:SWI/SNF complex subunit SWI3D [Lycium barbarum]|uniref:SWI/SNF complex subunit SWI3D n=1 Tax=Lycium barbarum TaxID=112863 RepID=UPI00293F452E|nr:SWI/SNF complex subunit SWI3D [Lycium barbarum]